MALCARWLAEHVIFRLTEDQPALEYQILTEAAANPIVFGTSCRRSEMRCVCCAHTGGGTPELVQAVAAVIINFVKNTK